jgi:hypothetical protein
MIQAQKKSGRKNGAVPADTPSPKKCVCISLHPHEARDRTKVFRKIGQPDPQPFLSPVEIADGMRRGGRDHRLGLPWRVVVASEGEKPFGMRCWEQSVEWDPDNDAPAIGGQGCFAVKMRLRDRERFELFRFLHSVKSKLEHAVRGCHMEFVVGLLVSRAEEDFEGIAPHERREVEWEAIRHHVPVMQFSVDHNVVVLAGYGDPARGEIRFGLRQPRLAIVPEGWRCCDRISFQSFPQN